MSYKTFCKAKAMSLKALNHAFD